MTGGTEAKPAFITDAQAKVVEGAGMRAVRETPNEAYLVITFGKAADERSKIKEIREALWKLPGTGSIEWVRPFTRRLQCLFG